jgi:hypothetical protein
VAHHQTVEKMPDRREVLLARGNAEILLPQSVEILPHVLGRDAGKRKAAELAPGEKLLHGVQVSATGMLVADLTVEELLGREDRSLPGLPYDRWQGK